MRLDWLAPLVILLSSLLPALLIFFLPEPWARLRNGLNLGGALIKVSVVALMLWGVYHGWRFELAWEVLPQLPFLLRIDSLSMLFITLSAVLWLLTTIYAIGYLAGRPHNRRFFGFFCLCVAATVGIAMAGNLFTLFIFYELLTLSTYPLVVHNGDSTSLRAGRIYLTYTLGGSAAVLAGAIWLHTLAGPVAFAEVGGALGHVAEREKTLTIIFWLLVGGFGVKAALVPLHRWLPAAMVAPAPVSALLHAVAVVKAGAFGIIRVIYDLYSAPLAHELGVTVPLTALAAATIIYGSLQALRQADIKRRLAYSTVSQVAYIVLGAALLGPVATMGALVHLVHQGIMKITMFFCAGSLAETLGVHRIDQLDGAGARMPWTMAAFSIAMLGMIGVPPLVGFISKWYLAVGALATGADWVVPVLLASSLLNAAYFLPLLYRAWFRPPPTRWPHEEKLSSRLETRASLLLPPLVTAALTLAFGLVAGTIFSPLEWARFIARLEHGP
jgi:multicomponent Na+:H+ antiporter subunit D